MKFKIIFGAVMIAMMVAMVSSVNITVDNISENKAGLTRLNKSFLSLSEEFESVGRTADLIESTRESYRNSLINLSDRIDTLEDSTFEIHSILKELDELLNKPPVATVVIEKYIEPEPLQTWVLMLD